MSCSHVSCYAVFVLYGPYCHGALKLDQVCLVLIIFSLNISSICNSILKCLELLVVHGAVNVVWVNLQVTKFSKCPNMKTHYLSTLFTILAEKIFLFVTSLNLTELEKFPYFIKLLW